MLEREVKLRFDSPEAARSAVLAAGATPLRRRRLQTDVLLDTHSGHLRVRRSALRVRVESDRTFVTFKGPIQAARAKLREELETQVEDGPLLLRLLGELGFHAWFRSEKYREEFRLPEVVITVDETPIGTFVEIEGSERGIDLAAEALGRGPRDYVLDSYRSLYERHCRLHGIPAADMVFSVS